MVLCANNISFIMMIARGAFCVTVKYDAYVLTSYSKMESVYECALCSKPYDDPRILSCLHSFCLQCIQRGVLGGSQTALKCPTCGQNTNIPAAGVSALSQNLHLEFEVEVARYVSKIANGGEVCCDHCIDGRNGPAVAFCCACRDFLCKLCQEHHRSGRKLSKHTIIEISKEGANQLLAAMKPREHYCSQLNHEDNKLNFYCETCNLLICRDCTTVAHKEHSVTELSTVAKAHQKKITLALKSTTNVVKKLMAAIEGDNKMIEQVAATKKETLSFINQTFETLRQTLEKRRNELLSELEAAAQSKTTALTLQKETFMKTVEDISYLNKVASYSLQTHTDHELVAIGELLSTELQASVEKVEAMPLTPSNHSCTSLSLQTDDLSGEISKFGQIFELSPSPSESTWTSTSLSVPRVENMFSLRVDSKTSKGVGHPHGGAQVKGELKPKAQNGDVVCGEVKDHWDGTYTVTLTPQTTGPHQLHITMDGQPIQRSPHDINVRPKPNYRALSSAHQVIKCSSYPLCFAIHNNGDIYVGSWANCIYMFDQNGQLKNTIGSGGSEDGQFNYPFGIAIKGDVLYVADYGNHRVQKLTARGEFLQQFGQKGSGQGQLNGPSAVIVDSKNRLIVSDYYNHRIQIFNEDGGWLLTIDGKGASSLNPWGLALDPQGNIHVAAYGSNAIKVFNMDGAYVKMYGDLKCPIGIAIDTDGYSLVCEKDGNCLSIIDPQGNKIHAVENLIGPYGAALDPIDGSVYVANFGASTVLKYSI